jgi:hypothetical protein
MTKTPRVLFDTGQSTKSIGTGEGKGTSYKLELNL